MTKRVKYLGYFFLVLIGQLTSPFSLELYAQGGPFYLNANQITAVQKESRSIIESVNGMTNLVGSPEMTQDDRTLLINDEISTFFSSPENRVYNDLDPSLSAQRNFGIKEYLETIRSWYPLGLNTEIISSDLDKIFISNDNTEIVAHVSFSKKISGTNNRGILVEKTIDLGAFISYKILGGNLISTVGNITDIHLWGEYMHFNGLREVRKKRDPILVENITQQKFINSSNTYPAIAEIPDSLMKKPSPPILYGPKKSDLVYKDLLISANEELELKHYRSALFYYSLATKVMGSEKDWADDISLCKRKIRTIEEPVHGTLRLGVTMVHIPGKAAGGRTSNQLPGEFNNFSGSMFLGGRAGIRYSKKDSAITRSTLVGVFLSYTTLNDLSSEKIANKWNETNDTLVFNSANPWLSAEFGIIIQEFFRISAGISSIRLNRFDSNLSGFEFIKPTITVGFSPRLVRGLYSEALVRVIPYGTTFSAVFLVGAGFNIGFAKKALRRKEPPVIVPQN